MDDLITVLEGDALATLAELDGPVDFVLLDGWKELYLPVIKLLEPKLSPGALVIADNTESADARSYLDYVHGSESGYVSFNFAVRDSDSMELTATPPPNCALQCNSRPISIRVRSKVQLARRFPSSGVANGTFAL